MEQQHPRVKARSEAGTLAGVKVPNAPWDVAGVEGAAHPPRGWANPGAGTGHCWEALTGSLSRCPPRGGAWGHRTQSKAPGVCFPVSWAGENHPLPSQGSCSPC